MPVDVIDSLKKVCSEYGHMTSDEVEHYFKTMEIERRLQMETWS